MGGMGAWVQGRPGGSHADKRAAVPSGGLRGALSAAALSVALCAAPPAVALFNTGDPITNPQVQCCYHPPPPLGTTPLHFPPKILFRKASAGVNTRWYQRSCLVDVQWPVPRAMGTVGGVGLFGGARVVAGSVSVRRAP